MAHRDRSPALRIRLVPSTEAIVSKSGVHFLRGREAFYLDARAAKKLADVYATIGELGFENALSALLSDDPPRTTGD